MFDAIFENEPFLRLGAFLGIFLLMALWEVAAPRRAASFPRTRRWPNNLGLVALNTLLVRAIFPIAAVGVAVVAEGRGWGLLPALGVGGWPGVVVAVVLLDLAIYVQHALFHVVPLLWRLHRMHHADLDFDVSTGLRFHPVEIVISMAIKLAVVAVVGAPALAVVLFEILLNGTSMFNHGNVYLAPALDRILRLAVVTPDMHRVHHSIIRAETDSNYGFNLSCWDRVFGTYCAQPQAGHEGMTIGINDFRDPAELALGRMLLQPLRGGEDREGDQPPQA